MFTPKSTAFALCLISFFCISLQTKAESYVGIQAGASFGNKFVNLKGNENVNYPNPPGAGELFKNTKVDDVNLSESALIGVKAGHYFDAIPFLGVEGEVNYSKPDFEQQVLTLKHPDFGSFQELQLKADVHNISGAVSIMARYPKFKRVMPYIGVGPTINYLKIKGTGRSGIAPGEDLNDPNVGVIGPRINEDSVRIGVQAKTGVRFALAKHLALDLEYRFNYTPIKVGDFRSLQDPKADYISHQVVGALVYRFGNIKW